MKADKLYTEGRNAFAAERIIWLHERIKNGSFPNAARLCEKFNVSESQAHRDVKMLRDLGAPMKFDQTRGGFRYTKEFILPDVFHGDDTENSLQAIASAEDSGEGSVQMRIPDTAVVELDSKVAAMELGKYIVSRPDRNNVYTCEFRNPDLFIGMILASGQNVRIIEPLWLRDRLIDACARLLEANADKTENNFEK